jgi:hypothetical protein
MKKTPNAFSVSISGSDPAKKTLPKTSPVIVL